MNDSSTLSRKEQFLTEENLKLLEAQVIEVCFLYEEKYKMRIMKGKYVKNALFKTIRHYKNYLKEFDCKLTSVDFFKTYSWFSYFLAEELHAKDLRYKVLNVAIWRMCEELKASKKLDDSYIRKIIDLSQNELCGNGDLGVGKNGLYITMKTAFLLQ